MNRYLLGPFVASGANLNGNEYSAGIPSPSAFLGFVGAFLRKLGHEDWEYSVLPILHQISLSEGRLRSEPGAARGQLKPVELSETLSGEVIFSIIFETPNILDEMRARKMLLRQRFAGGTLSTLDREPVHAKLRRIDASPLSGIKPRVMRGYCLVPPLQREGANLSSFGDEGELRAIRDFLGKPKAPGSGYVVPVPVGYRLLESAHSAQPRKGGRNDKVGHVYSEPGVGLAEFLSVRNSALAELSAEDLRSRMWRWSCDDLHRYTMFSSFHLKTVA